MFFAVASTSGVGHNEGVKSGTPGGAGDDAQVRVLGSLQTPAELACQCVSWSSLEACAYLCVSALDVFV